ncbi:MAG: hypothetical protein ACOY42_11035 [Pseudomonadota bacterium]|jgi:hypothetical protein
MDRRPAAASRDDDLRPPEPAGRRTGTQHYNQYPGLCGNLPSHHHQ